MNTSTELATTSALSPNKMLEDLALELKACQANAKSQATLLEEMAKTMAAYSATTNQRLKMLEKELTEWKESSDATKRLDSPLASKSCNVFRLVGVKRLREQTQGPTKTKKLRSETEDNTRAAPARRLDYGKLLQTMHHQISKDGSGELPAELLEENMFENGAQSDIPLPALLPVSPVLSSPTSPRPTRRSQVRQGRVLFSVLKEYAAGNPNEACGKLAAKLVEMLEDVMQAMPASETTTPLDRLPKNLEDYPKPYINEYRMFAHSHAFAARIRPLYKAKKNEAGP
jgi:hypothetical protein